MKSRLSSSWKIRKPAVISQDGIVSSQSKVASEVGAKILREGGNAVDAAIATSFALGAVEPWMSGIGGGGYMLIRKAGEANAKVINFGMKSPSELRLTDYPLVDGLASDLFPWPSVKDNVNVMGAKAVAIPGQVAGMKLAYDNYATIPWKRLVTPAADLAAGGVPVDWYCQLILSGAARDLAKYPASHAAFLEKDGYSKSSGWTALGGASCDLTQLSKTLKVIADKGPSEFYTGDLAKLMVSDLQAAGGRHTLNDFKAYKATIADASKFNYRDHLIFTTPEFTAGSTLERCLSLLENSWQAKGETPEASSFVAYENAIRQSNAERFESMGDTNAPEVRASCTTNFNIVDKDGMMVTVTQTLLSIFGSRLMLPSSGVLMNNGVMWFDPEPNKPNSIGPSKHCLSNMCPTLLERNDGARFSLGASGGRKIMPAVAQLTSFILDYKMDLDSAIHSPRIDVSQEHMTIADDQFSADIQTELQQKTKNITFAPRTIYPFNFGCPSIIEHKSGTNSAVTEVMSPWADSIAAGVS